ncbi:MAG: class I SAM-dependent methyltransferase, partial [Patescibacteria group bacterium]
LPEDPSEANRIITLLGLYFKGEVLPAIEKIRGRGDEGAVRAGGDLGKMRDATSAPTTGLVRIENEGSESKRFEANPASLLEEAPPYTEGDLKNISRIKSYLSDTKTKIFKLRDGRKVRVEIITSPYMPVKQTLIENGRQESLQLLERDLRIVTGLATGINKDDSVDQYLLSATTILAARDIETDQLVGYVAAKPGKIGGKYNNVFIWGNFELRTHHNVGLGTMLNSYAVKIGKKLIGSSVWSRSFIDFRTWNPAAYRMTQRTDVSVFPRPNDDGTGVERGPTAPVIAIMAWVAENYLHSRVNVNTGVVTGVKPAKNVNWLGVPRIDRFFREFVKIANGNAILTVVRLPRFFETIIPIREAWIRAGIWLKLLPGSKLFFRKQTKSIDWREYFKAYDVLLELKPYKQLLNRMVELAGASKEKKVLDLGSGTGNLSLSFASLGCKVTSIDNSQAGLAIHRGKDKTAKTVELDLCVGKLPEEDQSVDIVAANNVLNYLDADGRVKVYKETKRVLKPGGVVVFSVLKRGFKPINVLLNHMKQEYLELRKSGGRLASMAQVYREYQKMFPKLRVVGEANKAILEGVESGTYVLFKRQQILDELTNNGFEEKNISIEEGYAGQDYLIKITI